MSTYAGGMRFRLIQDNFENMVRGALDTLGWFDAGRSHKPVTLISQAVDPHSQIVPNLVGIAAEDMSSLELELGSNFEELRWYYYIDIFAEDGAVGLHLTGDIQDILKGKMASAGRSRPSFDVYDLSMTTPTRLFWCEIENVQFQRQRNFQQAQGQYWWTIAAEVVDAYYDEGDQPS